jgi:hypothetical protein
MLVDISLAKSIAVRMQAMVEDAGLRKRLEPCGLGIISYRYHVNHHEAILTRATNEQAQ